MFIRVMSIMSILLTVLQQIGEKGINISGGQRQRVSFNFIDNPIHEFSWAQVNLARALYYDADIVILDDSLSAGEVDSRSYVSVTTSTNDIFRKLMPMSENPYFTTPFLAPFASKVKQ